MQIFVNFITVAAWFGLFACAIVTISRVRKIWWLKNTNEGHLFLELLGTQGRANLNIDATKPLILSILCFIWLLCVSFS